MEHFAGLFGAGHFAPQLTHDTHGALKAAGPIDTEYSLGATPLVTLVKAIAARPDIKSVRITDRNVGDRGLQP